jgi:dipeptidyl aminopeptidase/acylaminoacyl peptidase
MEEEKDQLVQEAISHWAPRFTTNGVAVSDFTTVTDSVQKWSEWGDAWARAGQVMEDLGREALREGRYKSAGAHLSQAAVYYHFGKFVYVDYPEKMKENHMKAVTCLNDALPYLNPPGERVTISYKGFDMPAILRKPTGIKNPPIVIMLSGLDSTKEELRSTEQLFLERDLATLSIDGPGQGESEYDLPIEATWEDVGKAIVDFIETRADVDAQRIGVWGVSLGGFYAPRMVTGEKRIKACAALAGPYDMGECWAGLPELTRRTFAYRAHQKDQVGGLEVAKTLTLAGIAQNIECPLLIIFGGKDRLFSQKQAEKLAEESGGELLLLPDGNHGVMNVAAKHRYKTADWMEKQLKK